MRTADAKQLIVVRLDSMEKNQRNGSVLHFYKLYIASITLYQIKI